MEEIKEFRKANHLNQTQFGELVGVNKQVVSSWETGRHKPSQQHLEKILWLLNIHTGIDEKVDDIIEKMRKEGKNTIDILQAIKDKDLIKPYNESLIYRKVMNLY